jgi:hypothetical protein
VKLACDENPALSAICASGGRRTQHDVVEDAKLKKSPAYYD